MPESAPHVSANVIDWSLHYYWCYLTISPSQFSHEAHRSAFAIQERLFGAEKALTRRAGALMIRKPGMRDDGKHAAGHICAVELAVVCEGEGDIAWGSSCQSNEEQRTPQEARHR